MGVQQLVGLLAAGLAQELHIHLLHQQVLVALADGAALVLVVKGLGTQGLDVGEVAHRGGLDGLAAAVDAAAGAGHDLDEVILLFALAHHVQHLAGVGGAADHADPHGQAGHLVGGFLHALGAAHVGKLQLVQGLAGQGLHGGAQRVLDEAYFDYVDYPNSPDGVTFLKEFPNVASIRTFSHGYGLAGLRIGYGVAHASIIYELDKVREPYHISSVAQAAALAALNDKEYFEKSIRYNQVEREYMINRLRTMGLVVLESQANFLLVDVKTSAVRIYQSLLKRGVMVRSADSFGYPTAIRVSIGLREENNYFLDALKECLSQIV